MYESLLNLTIYGFVNIRIKSTIIVFAPMKVKQVGIKDKSPFRKDLNNSKHYSS